jgi:hypothetical protein
LRASLRAEYQVRDLRAESVRRLAEMMAWLPPGCALWRSFGGPLSLSAEAARLDLVEYRLRVLAWQQTEDGSKGRNRPDPPTAPPYAGERRRSDAEAERKAAAYLRRQGRRSPAAST